MNIELAAEPLRIIGIEASPYSVKLRAYCRYRRIPYIWLSRMPQYFAETQSVKPLIMPVVQYPDGSFGTDSTPIMLALEAGADHARTIFSQDPVINFLSFLIEDFADEWITKCLFHYRFSYDADRDYGPRWVMDDSHPQASTAEIDSLASTFLQRQTDRMDIVGCTPGNAPIIEQSFENLLAIMEPFVALEKFLFGTRPSLADFGLFGQLKTLATDPTPLGIIREKAPRLEHWVRRLDDLSGVEGEFSSFENLDESIHELGAFVTSFYLPYLRANFDAHAAGESSFELTIFDQRYAQPVFKYQAKCFEKLRKYFHALSANSRTTLRTRFALDEAIFTR